MIHGNQDKFIAGELAHDSIGPTKCNPPFMKWFNDSVVTNLAIILKVKFHVS